MIIKIIIPVFNPPQEFLESLSALKKDGLIDSVVVVNDRSTNGIVEKIPAKYPEVVILEGDGNLWWAGGIRMGMAHVLNEDIDVVCWLNHDCTPDFGTIHALAEEAVKTGTGAVSAWCVTRGHDNFPINPGFRNFKPIPTQELHSSERVIVDGVNGNCVAINARAIQKVGLPEPNKHIHYGDGPYTWRLHQAGFTNVVLTRRHASLKRDLERCISEECHSQVWNISLINKLRYYFFSPRSKFHWKNKFQDLHVFRGVMGCLIRYPIVQIKLIVGVTTGHIKGKVWGVERSIEYVLKQNESKFPELDLKDSLIHLSKVEKNHP